MTDSSASVDIFFLIGVLVRRGMLLLDGDDLAGSFDLLVVVEDELL